MEQFPPTRNDEIDLAELFAKLWRKRLVVVLVALVGFLLGGAKFLSNWLVQPSTNNASVELRFNFLGAQGDSYPNGQPFSLNDIISTNVLNIVFEQKNLSQYGLTKDDFYSAVAIAPFSTSRDFIEARYKSALAQKRITPAEIADLNDNYSRELKESTRRFAKLGLSLRASLAMPVATQLEILTAIPNTWARIMLENYGVLDITTIKPTEFDKDLVNEYEYFITTRYLGDYWNHLNDLLTALQKDEIGRLQQDPETGATTSTLKAMLDDLKTFHVDVLMRAFSISPISKDLNEAKFYLNNEILAKEEYLDETRRRAEILRDAYNQYVKGDNNLSLSDNNKGEGQNVTAQYGDEFLNRLMSIGDQLSDAKFKQELLNRSLGLRLQAENIATDLARLKRTLIQFEATTAQSNENPDATRVRREISHISAKLQSVKESIERIVDLREQRMLGEASSLYSLNSEPRVRSQSMSQIMALIKHSVIGLIAGLFIGLFVALVLAAIRK